MEQTHEEKLVKAIEYLRSRGKYVLDEDCGFTPTPYTERVDILEKYGAGGAWRGLAGPGGAWLGKVGQAWVANGKRDAVARSRKSGGV